MTRIYISYYISNEKLSFFGSCDVYVESGEPFRAVTSRPKVPAIMHQYSVPRWIHLTKKLNFPNLIFIHCIVVKFPLKVRVQRKVLERFKSWPNIPVIMHIKIQIYKGRLSNPVAGYLTPVLFTRPNLL